MQPTDPSIYLVRLDAKKGIESGLRGCADEDPQQQGEGCKIVGKQPQRQVQQPAPTVVGLPAHGRCGVSCGKGLAGSNLRQQGRLHEPMECVVQHSGSCTLEGRVNLPHRGDTERRGAELTPGCKMVGTQRVFCCFLRARTPNSEALLVWQPNETEN